MSNLCYGCADTKRTALGMPGSGRVNESVFTDSRTGRDFCAGCVHVLTEWELDGCPDPDDYPYPEWIGETDGTPAEGVET